jgi:hypothetical protein
MIYWHQIVSCFLLKSHTSVLVLFTSMSAKWHTLSPSKSSTLHFYPSLSRATPPTLFPIGLKTRVFSFCWMINLKILRNKLKFTWEEKTHNITESVYFFIEINHKLCKHNAQENFQIPSPRTTLHCHVRGDMSKSERVEGQKSLHTAGGSTGYLCSATVWPIYLHWFGIALLLTFKINH